MAMEPTEEEMEMEMKAVVKAREGVALLGLAAARLVATVEGMVEEGRGLVTTGMVNGVAVVVLVKVIEDVAEEGAFVQRYF